MIPSNLEVEKIRFELGVKFPPSLMIEEIGAKENVRPGKAENESVWTFLISEQPKRRKDIRKRKPKFDQGFLFTCIERVLRKNY